VGGPGSVRPTAGQGRGVGSCRLALLWHLWGRGWQPQGADMESWAMGREWGAPGGWAETVRANSALRDMTSP